MWSSGIKQSGIKKPLHFWFFMLFISGIKLFKTWLSVSELYFFMKSRDIKILYVMVAKGGDNICRDGNTIIIGFWLSHLMTKKPFVWPNLMKYDSSEDICRSFLSWNTKYRKINQNILRKIAILPNFRGLF